jgi:hypothetical protein
MNRIVKAPLLGVVAVVAAVVAIVSMTVMRPSELGPRDGEDLPPSDTGRVAVGDVAPDFLLLSYAGDTVTLSRARRDKNIVLVFYRGHW